MTFTKRRIVFMGTPSFAASALAALHAAGHEIVAVYTQPPRPAGRGQKEQRSAVHLYADSHNLPVFTPKSLKKDADARAAFAAHNAEVAVVAAYGLILPQDVLDAPKFGCINIHASLLPRWRGAAPIQRAIMGGDTESGVCIMQMEAGLDTGPVLMREATPITEKTTTPDLHDKLAAIGASLIVETMIQLESLTPQPQPEDGVTYAHMLTRDDGRINWHHNAADIARQLRALTPWPGVWCMMPDGARLKIHAASVATDNHNAPAGTLINADGLVACGDGSLLKLEQIQPENRKAMFVRDAVNGGALAKGMVLA